MNEELTNKVLEAMKKCKLDCTTCGGNAVCCKYDWQDTIQTLATSLLEERAKPKNDIWDRAPEWATRAQVFWESHAQAKRRTGPTFIRKLPKTRTRIMAEEIASAKISNEANLIDIIEQTIKNHFAELKEES